MSLVDIKESRQVILPGHKANVFRFYEDIPLFWDAWDVEVFILYLMIDLSP
jgi:alpha-mannosidase